jgi:hypothetical protein
LISINAKVLEVWSCELVVKDTNLNFAVRNWAAESAVGALIGGVLAVSFFPSLGQFNGSDQIRWPTWQQLSFSLTIGFFFALAQSCRLVSIVGPSFRLKKQLFLAWAATSTLGFSSIILVLWMIDPLWVTYFAITGISFIFMLPGITILGLGQWIVLRKVFGGGFSWVPKTAIGAALGLMVSALGFFLFLSVAAVLQSRGAGAGVLTILMYPTAIAGLIGFFQVGELRKTLNNSTILQDSSKK